MEKSNPYEFISNYSVYNLRFNVATDFNFRKQALKGLPTQRGVYVLCDLDNVPMYVGQSRDGIRQRVARHLTSARSDIIANRQIDVWEIAYVWAYPVDAKEEISRLEAYLFNFYNPKSQLMNGSLLPPSVIDATLPESVTVQVMSDHEIFSKRDPSQRLPRQATHYAQLVDHFLTVKNSTHISRAMSAHFARLQRYHLMLLGTATPEVDDEGSLFANNSVISY
jgi:hypothetical protein